MKYWINAVGYGLPVTIRLLTAKERKGNVLFRTWYGRYDYNKSTIKKLALIFRNR